MSFFLYEQHGSWAVGNLAEGMGVPGSIPISYEEYLELKEKPHEADNKFERKDGKLVRKQSQEQT